MRCETCKWWGIKDVDDSFLTTYDGEFEPIKKGWTLYAKKCCCPKIKMLEDPEEDGAVTYDESGYYANLMTSKNFGCIHHASIDVSAET